MPLITCPECQKEISDLAPACPHCGAPRRAAPHPAPTSLPAYSPTPTARGATPAPNTVKLVGGGCAGALVLFALFVAVVGRSAKPSGAPDTAAPAQSPPGDLAVQPATRQPVAPKLPPEPPPDPELVKLNDLAKWQGQLAADKTYALIWDAKRRDDLKLLLTGVSSLLASSGFATKAVLETMKQRKVFDAELALHMIQLRTGAYPEDFTTAVKKYLDDVKGEPHLGLWSPDAKGRDRYDITPVAAWLNRDQPAYIRELLASRASLGWPGWGADTAGPPLRPYLTYEVDALKWLGLLTQLTPTEEAQLAKAKVDANTTRVPIETLLGEYKNNEVRADGKFKGKLVQVAGVVGDVKKDLLDSVYVTLGTGAMFEIPVVQCFVRDASSVSSLSKGDRVTMRGRVDGLMMNVLVRDCEIVR